MASKFAWIIAGSSNYIPGITAFMNSARALGHKEDIILLSFRLPDEFLKEVQEKIGNVRIVNIQGEDQVRGTAIERFRVAVEMGKEYKAICLLDADMFLTANCDLFFRIAEAGFIVTGSNGMIINFNKAYQKQYNCFLEKDEWPYPKVHTSAPIFLGPKHLDWFERLYNSRRIDSWDDFLYLNLLGIKMGKYKDMIVLPPYVFTGIHHFGVKPVTGWMNKNGMILSRTEEVIYIAHGKFWDKGWYTGLMEPMERYYKDEQLGKRQKERGLYSRKVMMDCFLEYFNGPYLKGDPEPLDWYFKKNKKNGKS
ncbi:hypothetical protein KAW50_02705 [candidate division WOR-3 bacterium]|nr:hypothetical protein [candidate division WOR-3 bacterium]